MVVRVRSYKCSPVTKELGLEDSVWYLGMESRTNLQKLDRKDVGRLVKWQERES